MELKSFEISKEMVKRKEVGLIVERGQSFSSWIGFGERGLSLLLDGVELCCGNFNRRPFRLELKEGRRVFKLELQSNNAGRFLQCSVVSAQGKRFSLIFPKGRGGAWGWKILTSRLRSIGVVPVRSPSKLHQGDVGQRRECAAVLPHEGASFADANQRQGGKWKRLFGSRVGRRN